MGKIIMHIDLNAFFATAETIKDPSLIGKPLIVAGSSRRGIVSTASYEARKFGIHSAMPTYIARKLCPDVIIKSGDYRFYNELSNKFFSYIREYTPKIEIASCDECYADMTECMKDVSDPMNFLTKLQNDLYNKTKLKCSIGLASSKFIAKMASDLKKPMGITIIRKKDIAKYLYPLPIKDFYGIGKKTYPLLEEMGIKTIGDFALSENEEVKKLLGSRYDVYKEWINGNGSNEVISEEFDPKSIGNSETFLFDTSDYEEIKEKLFSLATSVSERAKKDEKIGYTISINIKDSYFKAYNRSKTIKEATNNFELIYNSAVELFEKNFLGKEIRLIGVTLSNLINKEDFQIQMSLFDIERHKEECATKLLISELNSKLKKDYFMKASDLKKKREEK